jgi:4-hydroxythreonine-4-phosphate dehydrogenase
MNTIGITIGEPAGIGPEVVLKSLPTLRRIRGFRFIIFAPAHCMQIHAKKLDISTSLPLLKRGEKPQRKVLVHEVINRIRIQIGTSTATTGRAAFRLITEGIHHALDNKIDALVTAPVCKYAINRAGIPFTGHTEMLRDLSGARDMLMFFVSEKMKAGLVTTHLPIQRVAQSITKAGILSKLRIMDDGLKRYFGIARPIIGVSALNPHAGEGGYMGKEEISVIKPALADAQKQGLRVKGPFPADTILLKNAEFDALLFMYHDQAMMPVKLCAWGQNVNVTLGLPFVRTSPDHGTGLDIAGRGIASPSSFIAAARVACTMVKRSKKRKT